MPRVLLGVTGSVAAIKVPEIVDKLQSVDSMNIEVQVVATDSALHFFDHERLPVKCYQDKDEWEWKAIGDPVLHIELRKWADLLIIAPLDANTMAKIAAGMCDNLLTCIVRAWDPARPLIFCPAMNTHMWDHPMTSEHLQTLEKKLHYIQIPPVSKTLACGDTGVGAMATVDDIASKVIQHFRTPPIPSQTPPIATVPPRTTGSVRLD